MLFHNVTFLYPLDFFAILIGRPRDVWELSPHLILFLTLCDPAHSTVPRFKETHAMRRQLAAGMLKIRAAVSVRAKPDASYSDFLQLSNAYTQTSALPLSTRKNKLPIDTWSQI